jgi:hypothetical protein
MDVHTDPDLRLLDELRRRRGELRESMAALEHALAAPSAAGTAPWAERVLAALLELSGDLREHVAITEGADGLYQDLERHATRLTRPIALLTREHAAIIGRIEALLTMLDAAEEGPDVDRVRRIGIELLMALLRHRQRGADLVFEAYDVDIGGET